MGKTISLLFFLIFISVGCSHNPVNCHEEEAGVSFENLKEGQTISMPFEAKFKIHGPNMKVKPAGELHNNTGHHHLIIDGQYIEKGKVIPADKKHIHFGKGQTSFKLDLKPGKYKLTLQFADGHHKSYGRDWSETISITVK